MRIPVLFFAALSLDASLASQEHEKKVQLADLPAPVEKTVAVQRQGATTESLSEECGGKLLESRGVITLH